MANKPKSITLSQHVETGTKYSGGSVSMAVSVAGILVWAYPELREIHEYIVAILTVVFNIALIVTFKGRNGAAD